MKIVMIIQEATLFLPTFLRIVLQARSKDVVGMTIMPGTIQVHLTPISPDRCLPRALLTSLVLAGWLCHAFVSPPLAWASAAVGGERPLIRVEQGVVSVAIAGTPLNEILRTISDQSGIRLVVHGSRREKISAEFQSVPLAEALRRLIKENFLFLYSHGTDGYLVEVWVLSHRKHASSPPPTDREADQRTHLGGSGSLDSLIVELQSGEAGQRARAALALGELQDERALDPVLRAMQGDEDPEVRQRAIEALADFGDRRAIAALAEVVSADSDVSVRQTAVEVLAKIGGHEAVEPLSRALREDPDPFVRYAVLAELVEIGGDHVQGTLVQALDDPHELIWAKAAELLDMQGARGRAP